MRILGIGVDIVEIARLDGAIQRQGKPLIDRCFLPTEQAYCNQQREPGRCYAARFAAKEAVSKALGTGIGAHLGWLSIEVRRKASGEPFVVLLGEGAETARRLGVTEIFLSLSHSEHYAVANAVAIGG
jgi:holo-[acyl-carrier protein] synthase